MTPPFVLDTSALLAHFRKETGHEIVGQLMEENPDQIFISTITWLEFQLRLKEITRNSAERNEASAIYEEILAQSLPVTLDTARTAMQLKEQAAIRLPNAAALIAATAKLRSATLIHRDAHFAAVPPELLRQYQLPDTTPSAAGG